MLLFRGWRRWLNSTATNHQEKYKAPEYELMVYAKYNAKLKSETIQHGSIVQLVERRIVNPHVVGSSPTASSVPEYEKAPPPLTREVVTGHRPR